MSKHGGADGAEHEKKEVKKSLVRHFATPQSTGQAGGGFPDLARPKVTAF